MSSGWLKLHRKIKENPIFRDSTKLHLWVYCLVNASHTGHKTILGRREVFLQPGQFVTGRHRAATETGLTEKQVRAGLKALERLEMVKLQTSQGQAGTIVTICNWQFYQHHASDKGQERAKGGPSEGQVGATTEEWEEYQNPPSPARAREEPPPDDQVTIPPDFEEVAMRIYGSVPLGNLTQWCRMYPVEWVSKAMAVTERRSKRSASYTMGILQDWQRQGGPDDDEGGKTSGGKHRRGGQPNQGENLERGAKAFEGL